MQINRPKNPNHDFTIEHYTEILREIKQSHTTLSFRHAHEMKEQILDLEKFIIMRHDVEFSITSAHRIAKADQAEGIQSTFFFLQTSDYNPFEENQALLPIFRKRSSN